MTFRWISEIRSMIRYSAGGATGAAPVECPRATRRALLAGGLLVASCTAAPPAPSGHSEDLFVPPGGPGGPGVPGPLGAVVAVVALHGSRWLQWEVLPGQTTSQKILSDRAIAIAGQGAPDGRANAEVKAVEKELRGILAQEPEEPEIEADTLHEALTVYFQQRPWFGDPETGNGRWEQALARSLYLTSMTKSHYQDFAEEVAAIDALGNPEASEPAADQSAVWSRFEAMTRALAERPAHNLVAQHELGLVAERSFIRLEIAWQRIRKQQGGTENKREALLEGSSEDDDNDRFRCISTPLTWRRTAGLGRFLSDLGAGFRTPPPGQASLRRLGEEDISALDRRLLANATWQRPRLRAHGLCREDGCVAFARVKSPGIAIPQYSIFPMGVPDLPDLSFWPPWRWWSWFAEPLSDHSKVLPSQFESFRAREGYEYRMLKCALRQELAQEASSGSGANYPLSLFDQQTINVPPRPDSRTLPARWAELVEQANSDPNLSMRAVKLMRADRLYSSQWVFRPHVSDTSVP